MANPVQLARNAKKLIDRFGKTVTVTWPAAGKEALLTGAGTSAPQSVTTKAFIYEKEVRLEGGAVSFQKRALMYDVGRSLSRATVKDAEGVSHIVKSHVGIAPNDVLVVQEVVLT
jgi:hypothetical protein